jgi:peptidoglycan/xylan/chitin deacetylase (PgdA/CDA1 family)
MDWDALGRLMEQGLEIGAHTRRHPRLDMLGTAALEDEILGGAAELAQRIGRRPRAFAYPYGRTSPAAVALVRHRFGRAVTTELRCLRQVEDAALLPRLDAYYFRAAGELERWGSAAYAARLGARRAARTARRLLGLS